MTVYLLDSCFVGYCTVEDTNFILTIQKKTRIEQYLLWKPENLYFCAFCLTEHAMYGKNIMRASLVASHGTIFMVHIFTLFIMIC